MGILTWDYLKNAGDDHVIRPGAFICDRCSITVYIPSYTQYDPDVYNLSGLTICHGCMISYLERTIGLEGKWKKQKEQQSWKTIQSSSK